MTDNSGEDRVAPWAPGVVGTDSTAEVTTSDAATREPGRVRRRRDQAATERKGVRSHVTEWVVLIVIAVIVALVIKTFLVQAFYIPSESMVPTLKVGDRVLVNKLSYDLHDVHRGDIVVFKAPPEAQTGGIKDLVKRVIGLPGDVVSANREGHVEINGKELDEPYLPAGTRTDNLPPTDVPAGRLFMMGDNRGASRDSRSFGTIAESAVIGRAFLKIWPIGEIGFL